jgi:hypothetical protein
VEPAEALVLGRGWDGDPDRAGGPRGRTPLLYACHSCFASPALARELLRRGADPNASFTNEHGRMSALYGAAGVHHRPELTELLLEAGANPDDGESLYHAVEAEDDACLRLLLGHGADLDRPGGETWRGDVPLRTPYRHAVMRARDGRAGRPGLRRGGPRRAERIGRCPPSPIRTGRRW